MIDIFSIIGVSIFFLICITIGFLASRKEDLDGFLIANRKLNTFNSVMTLSGTFVGATTFMVYTAFVFVYGISAIWIFIGYFTGFMIFIPFALYIKKESYKKNYYTITDFFKDKLGKNIALLIISLIFIWYFGTLSVQFIGGGKVLHILTGLSYQVCVITMCIVILIYLILGGFRSVVKTDIFQFSMIFIIIIIISSSLKFHANIPIKYFNPFNAGIINIIAFLILGILTPFASQDYYQKVFAMKDEKVVKQSFLFCAILVFIISIFLTYIGLVARENYQNIDPDLAALYSFTKLIPHQLRFLSSIAFFAAVLSTADTLLFILSVNFTNDFLDMKLKKKNPKTIKLVTRITMLIIGVLAVLLAIFFSKIIDVAIVFKSIGLIVSPIVIFTWASKIKKEAVCFSIITTLIILIVLIFMKWIKPELVYISLIGTSVFYGMYILIEYGINFFKKGNNEKFTS